MGKRSQTLPYPASGRIKITVELCPDSAEALQAMMDDFHRTINDLGYAPIVRAALLKVYRDGNWRMLDVETLQQAKHRQELRRTTRAAKPTLPFTKDEQLTSSPATAGELFRSFTNGTKTQK